MYRLPTRNSSRARAMFRGLPETSPPVSAYPVELAKARASAEARARLFGWAHAHAPCGLHQPLDEGVVDGVQDDRARAGGALLSLVAQEGGTHACHRFIQIGGVVHDDRVLAPHLCDNLLHLPLPRRDLRRGSDDLEP